MSAQYMTVVHLSSGSPDLDAKACCVDLAPGHGHVVSVVAGLLHYDHGMTSADLDGAVGCRYNFLAFLSFLSLKQLGGCFDTFFYSATHTVTGCGGQSELYVDTTLQDEDLDHSLLLL